MNICKSKKSINKKDAKYFENYIISKNSMNNEYINIFLNYNKITKPFLSKKTIDFLNDVKI